MEHKKLFYSEKFATRLIKHYSAGKESVVNYLKHYQFSRLLDIGCGDGSFSAVLANFSDRVYGVDIAKKAVDLARKKGIKAHVTDVDTEKLPFKKDFFEIIFCGEIIEHLFDPDHLLDEMYRVLKPKGILIITTPNLSSWLNRLALLFGYQPYLTEVSLKHNVGKFRVKDKRISGHIRVFTLRALKDLVKIHGFRTEKSLGVSLTKELPIPLIYFDKLFSKIPALAQYIVLILKKK